MRQFIKQIFLPAIVCLCLLACGGGLGGSPVGSLDGPASGGTGGGSGPGGALDSPGAGGAGGGSGTNSGGGTTLQYAQPYQGGYLDEGANPTGNFFHVQNENISLKCKTKDNKGSGLTFQGAVFPPGPSNHAFADGRVLRVVDAKAFKFHDETLKTEIISKPSWVDGPDYQMEVGTYNFDLFTASPGELRFYLLASDVTGSPGSGFKDCPPDGCVPVGSIKIVVDVGYRPMVSDYDLVPDCNDPNQAVQIPIVF